MEWMFVAVMVMALVLGGVRIVFVDEISEREK